MSAGKLAQAQAVAAGDALLAAPVAGQQAARQRLERQARRQPRGRAAMLWVAICALIGFRS